MSELKGKTVLVTGAGKRIGAEIVKVLHHAGANIVIHYRSLSEGAIKLAEQLNTERDNSVTIQQADLCDIEQLPQLVEQVIKDHGRLDVLVNNASSFYPTPIGEITEQHWDDLMCSNLKGPLFLSQAATPALKKAKGCIVNIVDIHGMRPMKGYPVYSSAKAGLVMLTQSLARELGPDIRVNAVAPGAILWPEDGMSQNSQDELLAKTALKKQGSPEDIARTVLFLVYDAAYITGQIIAVDGGRILNH